MVKNGHASIGNNSPPCRERHGVASPWNVSSEALAGEKAKETIRRVDALLALGKRCTRWLPCPQTLLQQEEQEFQRYLVDYSAVDTDGVSSAEEEFTSKIEAMNRILQSNYDESGPSTQSFSCPPASKKRGWAAMEQLRILKWHLDRQGSDGVCGVDEETFVRLLAHFNFTEAQLRRAFHRLDVECKDTLHWEQFTLFLLDPSEYVEDSGRHLVQATQNRLRVTGAHTYNRRTPGGLHKGSIICFATSPSADLHYTAAHDDCVKVWNGRTLRYETTLHHSAGVLITDLCHLPLSNRLAVSQLDRLIFLYDCSASNAPKVFKGGTTEECNVKQRIEQEMEVTTMECRSKAKTAMQRAGQLADNSHLGVRSRLITTKSKVEVTLLHGLTCSPVCMAACPERGDSLLVGADDGGVTLWNFRKEAPEDDIFINPLASWKPHQQWVSHIKVASNLGAFISNSYDDTLQVWSIETGESLNHLRILNEAQDGPQSRIHSFDYSESSGLISSCGGSSVVFLWDPDVNAPLTRLNGHRTPVVDVLFTKDWTLLSLGEDQIVKFWDLRTFQCYQTVSPKENGFGDGALTILHLEPHRGRVIVGEFEPVAFHTMDADASDMPKTAVSANYEGHRRPITKALYNEDFDQVVTMDGQLVMVWDVAQQKRVAQWSGSNIFLDIVFDIPQRHLLTTDTRSSVVMWSYLKGSQIKEFTAADEEGLMRVLHVPVESLNGQSSQKMIVAAGRRHICLWKDHPKNPFTEDVFRRLELYDNGDISGMSYSPNSTIVVGTERGIVLAYSLSTHSLVAVFAQGVSRPTLPKALQHVVHQCGIPGPAQVHSAVSPASPARKHHADEAQGDASDIVALQQLCAADHLEDLCFLQPTLLAVAMGTGAVYIWRLNQLATEAMLSFWAAHTVSDEVTCLCVDQHADADFLVSGDGGGYLSLFDLKQLCNPDARGVDPISLAACWKCSPGMVHQIAWLSSLPALLAAASDGLLRCFGLEGEPMFVFGLVSTNTSKSLCVRNHDDRALTTERPPPTPRPGEQKEDPGSIAEDGPPLVTPESPSNQFRLYRGPASFRSGKSRTFIHLEGALEAAQAAVTRRPSEATQCDAIASPRLGFESGDLGVDARETHQFTTTRVMMSTEQLERRTPRRYASRMSWSWDNAAKCSKPDIEISVFTTSVALTDLLKQSPTVENQEEAELSISYTSESTISPGEHQLQIPTVGRKFRAALAPTPGDDVEASHMQLNHRSVAPGIQKLSHRSAIVPQPSRTAFKNTGDGTFLPRPESPIVPPKTQIKEENLKFLPKSRVLRHRSAPPAARHPPEQRRTEDTSAPVAGNAFAAARKLSQLVVEDVGDDNYSRFKRYASKRKQGAEVTVAGMPMGQIEEMMNCSAGLCARLVQDRKQPKNSSRSNYSCLRLPRPKAVPNPREVFEALHQHTRNALN